MRVIEFGGERRNRVQEVREAKKTTEGIHSI